MTDPHLVMKGPLARRKAAAEARIQAALDALEDAQALVHRAAQALCSINGLCAEYERLRRLYDHVHRTWYAVRDKARAVGRRSRLTLDHEPDAHEEEFP